MPREGSWGGARSPSESLRESAGSTGAGVGGNPFLVWALLAALMVWTAALEWLHLAGMRPWPWVAALLAVAFLALAGWSLRRASRGEAGPRPERRVDVRRSLRRLRRSGYRVSTNLPGNGYDVANVLIGPAGVFVVETAPDVSKLEEGTYDLDDDPVLRVKTGVRFVGELMALLCAGDTPIHAVIAVEGDVPESLPREPQVTILPEADLVDYVLRRPICLCRKEVRAASRLLDQYVEEFHTPVAAR